MLIDYFRQDTFKPRTWRIAVNDPAYVCHDEDTVTIRDLYGKISNDAEIGDVVFSRKWKDAHAEAVARLQQHIRSLQQQLALLKNEKEPKSELQ